MEVYRGLLTSNLAGVEPSALHRLVQQHGWRRVESSQCSDADCFVHQTSPNLQAVVPTNNAGADYGRRVADVIWLVSEVQQVGVFELALELGFFKDQWITLMYDKQSDIYRFVQKLYYSLAAHWMVTFDEFRSDLAEIGLRKRDSIKGTSIGEIYNWIRTTARNLQIDQLRRVSVARQTALPSDIVDRDPPSFGQVLEEYCPTLTADEQNLLMQIIDNKQKIKDMAAESQISENTLSKRYTRILQKMRKIAGESPE